MSNSAKIMFIMDIFEYKINNRNVYLLSEAHQEFKSKIPGCKSKGYITIDEYVRSKENPVVILELSDEFSKKYTETYSTNLNILQQMDDVAKMYADIRFNIYSGYQHMYDRETHTLTTEHVQEMISIKLDKVRLFHEKMAESCSGYSSSGHKQFVEELIVDAEENIKLLSERFKHILKTGNYRVLSDLNYHRDAEFMELTSEYKGRTLPERIHEVIKHSWKKITDICIMVILLSKCLNHDNVIILLGAEHVTNLNHIIDQYKAFCRKHNC